MNNIDTTKPAAPLGEGVMASTNKVLITYLLSMVLAALPIVLLVDDAHWLNILAFTYLMGGLAA
ncbi:hypothetical protein, partial [Klebsiella pneumoniae]|uniref:hypothetical protein n=1 Tax=Klebsiella pneumoniae TaxID=573 RepID=UPI00117BDA3A